MGKVNKDLKQLKTLYKIKKVHIIKRLREFKDLLNKSDKKIFEELCFCILTPQSKAETADKIIKSISKNGFLFKATQRQLQNYLKPIRFYRKKAMYIAECRKIFFKDKKMQLKELLRKNNPFIIREWLVKNIKGIGYKEASHFLRNIGLGKDLAILDRHILKNLKKYGVIEEIPQTLTAKKYIKIEEAFRRFSAKINIPLEHLDFLFWSLETGKIFK